ncbi:MAG TPA: methylmalonyl Co-A mutase-associated GTPase MeaB [Polyangiaceae bacterium]|nr:methylmalonyl Co-A mutase-associated GTPase MeaB [Polyangiaceae bacterium]
MADSTDDPAVLAAGVAAGDRRALGRAITLVESERAEDAPRAEALLASLLPRTGGSRRLGVTGPPGAGKSTLIDALGRRLLAHGESVAVLAIDPSSPLGGGSILGDKTRMGRLAAEPKSFIRPSPSRGASGGVGWHTAETILLCEAAGYSVVVVETLGTGQGEHAVFDLVDCLVLLASPGAGDELQGMKRGALELADVVVVNKADGEQRVLAERAVGELTSALGLFARATGAGAPVVLGVSASEERGLDELWAAVEKSIARARESGAFERRRTTGAERTLAEAIERAWRAAFSTPTRGAERDRLEREVLAGRLSAREAARRIVLLGRGE